MLTENDSNLINTFYHSIIQEFGKIGVPVRNGGNFEERDNAGNVYLTLFYFQVGMQRFELYVNNNVSDVEVRYGWQRL